jgi:NADH-quinone oxidoreductase subunit L
VRPATTFGRFGRTVIESVFVQDVIIGGSVAVVRAGSSFARGLQTGYLRWYAVLLITGLAALAIYILISAT